MKLTEKQILIKRTMMLIPEETWFDLYPELARSVSKVINTYLQGLSTKELKELDKDLSIKGYISKFTPTCRDAQRMIRSSR